MKLGSKTIDLAGQKYGRLTVESFAYYKRGPSGHKNAFWWCVCDCGNRVVQSSNHLRSGNTRSCGCLKADEIRRTRSKPYPPKLLGVHSGMIVRCNDPGFKYYDYYGGRGITVCDEWSGENGLDNFRNWAINNGYQEGLTIDRIDNDKGYSPDNCRWVNRYEQGKNKRNNVTVTINGVTKILAEWCRELNIDYSTVKKRRSEQGWSVEEALLIPTSNRNKSKEERIKEFGLKEVLATAHSNVDDERLVFE